MDAAEGQGTIEVVYALRDEQTIVTLAHRAGMTAGEAFAESGLAARYPEIGAGMPALGLFNVLVQPDHLLTPGDRVEICRPLVADPRDMRRDFVGDGKVMGGRDEAEVRKKAVK